MCVYSNIVFAHALDPSLLTIQQQSSGEHYSVIWKTPIKTTSTDILLPSLPKNCQPISDKKFDISGTSHLVSWNTRCVGSIQGQTLSIENIEKVPNHVVVRVTFNNQQTISDVLSNNKTSMTIPKKSSALTVFKNYFWMGIYHLITGWDHLLLVIGLLFLATSSKKLLIIISSFTLGHSITLSLSVLNYIHFPPLLAEILIALSLVFVGASVVNKKQMLSNWHELGWLMALFIGLIHGLGFAGALLELGIPNHAIPLSLFSFNLGIELGQIIIIALLIFPTLIYPKIKATLSPKLDWAGYFIGVIASFWFWQRLLSAFA